MNDVKHKADNRGGLHFPLDLQKQVIRLDKGNIQCRKCNLGDPVFLFQKQFEIPQGIFIGLERGGLKVYTYTFGKLFDIFLEVPDQARVLGSDTLKPGFYLPGGNPVADSR